MTTGYCVKCRTKREIQGATAVTLKNGRPATKGTCPECNTNMFRIGKASEQISLFLKNYQLMVVWNEPYREFVQESTLPFPYFQMIHALHPL